MTNPIVNFYILADKDPKYRMDFTYQLLEKALQKNLSVLILVQDAQQQSTIDDVIWSAKPQRFIPHEIITDNTTLPLPPVLISQNTESLTKLNFSPDVVIDLSHNVTVLDYSKIILIGNQHPDVLPNTRMKYQSYREKGITPNIYKMGESL